MATFVFVYLLQNTYKLLQEKKMILMMMIRIALQVFFFFLICESLFLEISTFLTKEFVFQVSFQLGHKLFFFFFLFE
jgi:hypothetical protein